MSFSISDNGTEDELYKFLESSLDGDSANTVMLAVRETYTYPPMTRETIAGDEDTIGWIKFPSFLKPSTGLIDYDKIEEMLATGQIAHPMSMKKAPIVSIVSNKSGFSVSGADERLAEFMAANLFDALPRAIDEILTYLEYGAYYGEVTWEPIYPQEYELARSPIPMWGISGFHGCHPTTIDEILRTEKDKRFRGYVQRVGTEKTTVGLDRAFIVSNDGLFGNLSGKSVLEPVYLWWFWYELIWRAFLRYLQRCGVGVVAVKAPPRQKVRVGNQWKDSLSFALEIASSLHRTNYAAFPSEVDPETKTPLWSVDYLKVGDREGDQFIAALELLATNIRQHLLTGSPKDEESGEFQIMLDTERVLANISRHINRYVLRKASMFNSSKSRRLELGFQGANTTVLPLLFKLMAVAGNTVGDALRHVDWRHLFMRGGVPILDEEEVEKLKEEDKEDRQDYDPFGRSRSQYREIQRARGQPGGEGSWASRRDREGQAEKLEQIYELLSDAMNMNIVPMTNRQRDELIGLGLLEDSQIIELFNPYHDTIGRFTDKAHATKPLPEGLYHSHGFVGPVVDFRTKDAASLASEKIGQEPIEVHTYSSWIRFSKGTKDYGLEKGERRAIKKNAYAVYIDGKIHVTPRGAKAIRTRRKFGEYMITHESRHGRKRSDGSREASLVYEVGNRDSFFMAHSRKILEEGTVDLLTRRDLDMGYRDWLKDYQEVSYLPYMGAVAIIVAAASGWNRARAWQLIDQINYRINDDESIWAILEEVLGSPSGGWNGTNFYMLLQKLQVKAAAGLYKELGWLFGGSGE